MGRCVTSTDAKSIALVAASAMSAPRRVAWVKITSEPLQPGDMWASHDPNTPYLQKGFDYNLIMQAVHASNYGSSPPTTLNGAYWRPVGLVPVTDKELNDTSLG
jgi:hypothetical protein